MQTEIERTFILKNKPSDFADFKEKEMLDLYLPAESNHAKLRLRKINDNYSIMKKFPKIEWDNSIMIEQVVELTIEEFNCLMSCNGNLIQKTRYKKEYDTYSCEVDIFKANLEWFAVVDFEFNTIEDAQSFKIPDYCWIEITQVEWLAWWMIAGKDLDYINHLINSQIQ